MADGFTLILDDLVSARWMNGPNIPSGTVIKGNGRINLIAAEWVLIWVAGETEYLGESHIDATTTDTVTIRAKVLDGMVNGGWGDLIVSGNKGELRVNGKPVSTINGKKINSVECNGAYFPMN